MACVLGVVLAVVPAMAAAVSAAAARPVATGASAPEAAARRSGIARADAPPSCSQPRGTPGRWMPEAQGWRAVIVPRPAPIPVGRHFALEVALCPPAGAPPPTTLKVDADMPAHRHGMNYRPQAVPQGGGRFRVDGLMFHMPGYWRLMLEVETADGPRRLEQPVEVR